MNCLYCGKPILKYPSFSVFDPEWVHAQDGMPRGSQFCEGNNPCERTSNAVATPSSTREPRMSYREAMIDAGRGHLLGGSE